MLIEQSRSWKTNYGTLPGRGCGLFEMNEPGGSTEWQVRPSILISSNHSDGRYFEVTWDGERERFYLDVYSKIENQALNIEGESAWLQR